MGNYKFRLSDMVPNSWFYKLRDMGKATRSQTYTPNPIRKSHSPRTTTTSTPCPPPQPSYLPNRPSYYFPSRDNQQLGTEGSSHSPSHPKATDTQFPLDPPRKSKKKIRRKPIRPSSNLQPIPDDLCKPIFSDHLEFDGVGSWSPSSDCKVTSSATDIIIDMKKKTKNGGEFIDFLAGLKTHLPPILTKPVKKEAEKVELDGRNVASRPSTTRRIKVRPNSPKMGSRRIRPKGAMQQRKGLSESLVVVKSSADPQKDFKESMVEMIVENNIRASKDLEELLACYLSLNSNEYHDMIVKVFEQIWLDLTDVRL